MDMLVNIDVPDLPRAEAFYCAAFGLRPGRRFGGEVVELLGAAVPIYLGFCLIEFVGRGYDEIAT